jgi:hypothetical protein
MSVELLVQQAGGKEWPLGKFALERTGLDVKKAIAASKGFATEVQLLSVVRLQTRLDDNMSLGDVPGLEPGQGEIVLLSIFSRQISLRVLGPESLANDVLVKLYPCCAIADLKQLLRRHTKIPVEEQTLSYNGITMSDGKLLVDYNLKDPEDGLNQTFEEANATTTSRPFEIRLFRRQTARGKFALGLDCSFNAMKDVKKVSWHSAAPSHREVTDGVSWFCYCRNARCPIANELFIISKGMSKA